jgi:hypothetical protein
MGMGWPFAHNETTRAFDIGARPAAGPTVAKALIGGQAAFARGHKSLRPEAYEQRCHAIGIEPGGRAWGNLNWPTLHALTEGSLTERSSAVEGGIRDVSAETSEGDGDCDADLAVQRRTAADEFMAGFSGTQACREGECCESAWR